MQKTLVLIALVSGLFLLNSCHRTSVNRPVTTSETPVRTNPVDVANDYISPQAIPPEIMDIASANLFDNSGFEAGLEGWTACDTGAIEESGDAYEGSKALKVNQGNCFYRSAEVNSGQELILSCYARIESGSEWTGMGLSFADSDWKTIDNAPTTIITGNTYARYDVRATTPENSSYASMWLYSDNPAIVDNCRLLLEQEPPVPPPPAPNGDNLLDNGNFETLDENILPVNWTRGCGGSWASAPVNGQGLTTGGGICIDQSLSATDIASLSGQNFTYSCYAKNVSGYGSITIFLDGKPQEQAIPVGDSLELIEISAQAGQISSGFVSIYSEGSLFIDDCSLTVEGNEPEPVGTPSIDVRNNIEGPDGYALSGPYTFEVAVRNNGDVPFTNVKLESDLLDCSEEFLNLAVGESKTIECLSTAVATPTEGFSHVMTATATTADGQVVSDADQSGYRPALRASPRAILNIATENQVVPAGSDVKFVVTVANAGNVSGISEIESNVADCSRQYTPALGTGDIKIYECVAANVQEGFIASVNVVMVGAYRASAQDAIAITIENSVAVDISVNTEGDDLTTAGTLPLSYRVAFRNSGEFDLQNVQVTSTTIPDCQRTINTFVVGDIAYLTCNTTPQLADGEVFTHEVFVVGEAADGRQATDSDVARITYRPKPEATFDLKVNGQNTYTANGQPFEVELTVTNTGDAEILTLGLFDWRAQSPDAASNSVAVFELCPNEYPRRSLSSSEPAVDFVLGVGQSRTFTCVIDRAPFLTAASEIRVAGTVWAGRDMPNLFFATSSTFDVMASP